MMAKLTLFFASRPVFLFSSIVLLAASVWAANAGTSFSSHLAARVVQGLAAGATESLLPLIITDMTYIHQRAYYFGVYWVVSRTSTSRRTMD